MNLLKKTPLLAALAAACSLPAAAVPTKDSTFIARLRTEILTNGTCYDNLRVLCKTIGHRISGSPAAAKAVAWGEDAMRAAGADLVYLQPCMVPHWVRGRESLEISTGRGGAMESVPVLSLGNSDGTGGKPLTGEIVYAKTLAEFQAMPDAAVRGKIVFFDYHFRQDFLTPFDAYGDAIWLRGKAPGEVARRGGAGLLIRSLSSAPDDAAHTGAMRYPDSVRHIPCMAIGNTTADRLAAACAAGPARARMTSECRMLDKVLSFNVVGEIRGYQEPGEVILVGGHLDSWDVGEGAHDDGAGCVQSIEVLRTLKAMGYRPKHTIRAVLFMNEENGLRGGVAYADTAKARREKHLLAIESDAGGFAPRGFGLLMDERKRAHVRQWAPLLALLNIHNLDGDEAGADISPLHAMGVPLSGLIPESQRYFDYHHTDRDVFEAVNHRELKLGAVAMAALIYLVDQYGLGS